MSNVVILPGRATKSAPDGADPAAERASRLLFRARDSLLQVSSSLTDLKLMLEEMRQLLLDETQR